uniref:Uncharacterized protein n=1 Tax=Arundo donax TaxID=35708 RepID=A0A0A9HAN7_ARUDO
MESLIIFCICHFNCTLPFCAITGTMACFAGLLSMSPSAGSLKLRVYYMANMSGIMISASTSKLYEFSLQNVWTFVRIQNFISCGLKKHEGANCSTNFAM